MEKGSSNGIMGTGIFIYYLFLYDVLNAAFIIRGEKGNVMKLHHEN